MYPATEKTPNGKLRLMYECNPMAFIAEQAGGKASNGFGRIMEIQPTELHQRVPFYSGNKEMVEKALIAKENNDLLNYFGSNEKADINNIQKNTNHMFNEKNDIHKFLDGGFVGNTDVKLSDGVIKTTIGDVTGTNTIAYSGQNGVSITGVLSVGNTIAGNNIRNNTGLGILLRNTRVNIAKFSIEIALAVNGRKRRT